MADKDREDAETPSLEMPSLGRMLRRRKDAKASAEPTPEPESTTEPQAEAEATTEAEAEPTPEPITEPEPVAAAEPVPDQQAPAPEPAAPPLFADEVATDDEATAPTPAAAEAPTRGGETRAEPAAAQAATAVGVVEDREEPAEDADAVPGRRGLRLPALPDRSAAAFTGIVVGLLGVGLTWLGLQGCEYAKGTQSCGGVGLLMLLLIVAAMVLVGKVLLAAWGLPDSLSVSFLAVGLIAVICLLVLIDLLFSTWIVVVLPLLGAAAYALSQWVTQRFATADLD